MLEVADIFRLHGPQYRAQFGDRMLPSHRRTMQDIEQCRTAVLGGQIYFCNQCQEQRYSYHSCKNPQSAILLVVPAAAGRSPFSRHSLPEVAPHETPTPTLSFRFSPPPRRSALAVSVCLRSPKPVGNHKKTSLFGWLPRLHTQPPSPGHCFPLPLPQFPPLLLPQA